MSERLWRKELRAARLAGNAPFVVGQETPGKAKLACKVPHLDPQEAGELAHECLNLVTEPRRIAFDLRLQQNLDTAVREPRAQFVYARAGSRKVCPNAALAPVFDREPSIGTE